MSVFKWFDDLYSSLPAQSCFSCFNSWWSWEAFPPLPIISSFHGLSRCIRTVLLILHTLITLCQVNSQTVMNDEAGASLRRVMVVRMINQHWTRHRVLRQHHDWCSGADIKETTDNFGKNSETQWMMNRDFQEYWLNLDCRLDWQSSDILFQLEIQNIDK